MIERELPTEDEGDELRHQLDMDEDGPRRGDDILHSHGSNREGEEKADTDPKPVDKLMNRYSLDLSEEDREGDEESGDEHSSGLQGTG